MQNQLCVRNAGAAVVVLIALAATEAAFGQTPVSAGYRDFSFGATAISTPTGEKPESKLWWNDGSWWGVLFNPAVGAYRIHVLDLSTHRWTDTGTTVDTRANSKGDVLWDEAANSLYVASHVFSNTGKSSGSSSQWGRLYRFTYDASRRRYTLDSGFPVSVTRGIGETLTLAKDSVGRLWVTYVEGGRVKVNWSRTDDRDWGTPVDLPAAASTIRVSSDDISSVVAFGGAFVGVMWSNELTAGTYFAVHRDDDPAGTWQAAEDVLTGCTGACSDDHINLKADQNGRVFAAVKTSLEGHADPLVVLAVRSTGTPAAWSTYLVGLEADHHTRPIVLLDEGANRAHVVATSGESGGAIYLKSTRLDFISFPSGRGEAIIQSNTDVRVNNATSTKQNLTSATGLLVAASDQDTRYYLHAYRESGSSPTPVPPLAPTGLEATAVSATRIDLSWTDATLDPGSPSNEDAFSIERSTGGSFAEIASVPSGVASYVDTTAVPDTTHSYRVRARNTAGTSPYSNTAIATTPPADPPPDDTGGTTLELATFEGGALVSAGDGVDRVTGAVSLETAAPLAGAYSARILDADTSYLEESFAALDDLHVSMQLRLNARPVADARLVLVSNAGTTVGNLVVRTTGRLRLRVGSTVVGVESAALQPGQLYRVAVRQRRGSGGNAILEAYLAAGDASFGTPFASVVNGSWTTAADRVRVGATSPAALDAVIDNLRLAVPAAIGPASQQ